MKAGRVYMPKPELIREVLQRLGVVPEAVTVREATICDNCQGPIPAGGTGHLCKLQGESPALLCEACKP